MNYEDDLINEAFEEFTTGSTPVIKFAGASVVKAEAKQRRRLRTTMLSVLAALVIITPVAAFAAMNRGNHGPPVDPASTPSAAPDGRLTAEQLIGATITIPKIPNWEQCGGGAVKILAQGSDQGEYSLAGTPIVYANLDDDPALETVTGISCVSGDPSPLWLMAFDRGDDGKVVTLGAITAPTDSVKRIRNLQVRAEGGVKAEVCVGCGSDSGDDLWVPREYHWNGSKFAQVGGPDGVIGSAELLSKKLPVPAWGKFMEVCPSGQVQLVHTHATSEKQDALLQGFVYSNLDGDAAFETAVLIHCKANTQAGVTMVVVFDRDERGEIVLRGKVLVSSEEAGKPRFVLNMRAGAQSKNVLLDVAKNLPTDETAQLHHEREYGWDGTKYVQVGGPTKF